MSWLMVILGLLFVEGSIGCAVECGGVVWIVVGVVGKM